MKSMSWNTRYIVISCVLVRVYLLY